MNSLIFECDGTHDDGTKSPEHLQHLSAGSSQSEGDDLAAVRGSVGNEDPPRNSFEELRQEQDAKRVAKIEDEDEAVEDHKATDNRPPVPDAASNWTRDKNTDDRANRTTALESRLPSVDDDLVSF